jgi:Na+/proline symporter
MILEYVTLGIYLLALPLFGVVCSKLNSNVSDFVRGGGQGTWWLVGTSILMSNTSAFTFTGNASAAFEAGPTVLIIYFANVVALSIGAWFLGAWFRQTRAYTRMDLVRMRFGVGIEQFSAYTTVMLAPVAAAIQLWALAVIINSVFGLPVPLAIFIIGCVVISYSTMGGKWAVMAADFAQSLVLFSITILVGALAIIKIGGVGEFFSFFTDARFAEDFRFVKEPDAFPTGRFSMKWIVVIFFMTIYQQISLNAGDRYLTVRDGKEARKASALAAVLMAVGTIIWFIPPMVARFLYQDEILAQEIENPSNSCYIYIARELLPNGLMGIMIAALFSATVSAMDSGLNVQVGIIARNMVPALRRLFGYAGELSERGGLILCKVLTLAIGLLIISYALLFSLNKELILFDAYLTVNSIIGIPLVFPLIAGLWIRKVPWWSYFAITLICMIPSGFAYYQEWFLGIEWTIQDRALWIFVFGIVGTLLTMPFYRFSSDDYKRMVEEFFTTMHTPVDFLKEIGVSRNYQQLDILGKAALVIGAAMLLFLLVPNTWQARTGVIFISAFSLAVSGLLLWGARAEKRRAEREAEVLRAGGSDSQARIDSGS